MGGRGNSLDELDEIVGNGGGGGSIDDLELDMKPNSTSATASEVLGKKGRPMSYAEAVEDANPFHLFGAEYQYNCQRCVASVVMRLKGYDVIALPTFNGDTLAKNMGYLKCFDNPQTDVVFSTNTSKGRKGVISELNSAPNGSVLALAFDWKGNNGGHAMVVIKGKSGKLMAVDGQTGKKVNLERTLKNIDLKRGFEITRVDNLTVNDNIKDFVVQNPTKKGVKKV